MDKLLKLGDEVYHLLIPRDTHEIGNYEYTKCRIVKILYKHSYQHESIKEVEYNLAEHYQFDLEELNTHSTSDNELIRDRIYKRRLIDRIYLLDEKDRLLKDIEYLNFISSYRKEQNKELQNILNKKYGDYTCNYPILKYLH